MQDEARLPLEQGDMLPYLPTARRLRGLPDEFKGKPDDENDLPKKGKLAMHHAHTQKSRLS